MGYCISQTGGSFTVTAENKAAALAAARVLTPGDGEGGGDTRVIAGSCG